LTLLSQFFKSVSYFFNSLEYLIFASLSLLPDINLLSGFLGGSGFGPAASKAAALKS